MINISDVQDSMNAMKREKLLSQHPYKIWQGKDGKWRTYISDEVKGRKLICKTNLVDVENIIIDFWKRECDNPTVKNIFDRWIEEKLLYNEISRVTYDRYVRDFNRYFYSEADGKFELLDYKTRVKDISEADLEKFIKGTIVKMELTNKAYANMRTLVRGIFKYAKRNGYTNISVTNFFGDLDLSRNSFKKIDKPKEYQVYQENELPIMLDYLNNHSNDIELLGILLVFQTGMRVGELVSLQASDISNTIHISKTEIRYRSAETGKMVREVRPFPKTQAGDRYIIMTDGAKETIKKILELNPDGEYLMEKNGRRISGTAFDSKIARICKKLGFPRKSMHKIRKTYGTLLLDADVDESIVAEQMGHSDISCTRKYYYFCNKNQKTKEKQIKNAIGFIK